MQFFKHINSDICTRRLNFIEGQEEEEMKLCLMILSVPWYTKMYINMGRSPNYGRNSNILISDPCH
jgi:hypothetical protein